MSKTIKIDTSFFAKLAGRYLKKLEAYSQFYPPGRYQQYVLLQILEHGFASAPLIRDDLSRDHEGWSTVHVGKRLREVHSKGLVKERKVAPKDNPHRHKFYELTTVGLHSLLLLGAIRDLEKVWKYYPNNEIFWLFLYPFFSENTFRRPTRKLQSIVIKKYFPSLCAAMESALELLEEQRMEITNENARLIVKNLLMEEINFQLLYITFLNDPETVRLLSQDDFFKIRLKTVKIIVDRRYNEMVGPSTGPIISTA